MFQIGYTWLLECNISTTTHHIDVYFCLPVSLFVSTVPLEDAEVWHFQILHIVKVTLNFWLNVFHAYDTMSLVLKQG